MRAFSIKKSLVFIAILFIFVLLYKRLKINYQSREVIWNEVKSQGDSKTVNIEKLITDRENSEIVNSKRENSEIVNSERGNTETVNSETGNSEAAYSETVNSATEPQIVNPETVNAEIVNAETSSSAIVNAETSSSAILNPETVTPETVSPETVDSETERNVEQENSELKYILQWTSPDSVPFSYMGTGQQGFIDRKCPYTNCIVTANRLYFDDYAKFDVIAFSGPDVIHTHNFPLKRSPHQKYVFATIESSHNYPVCSDMFDGYFNWTWTFRLDSEVRWGYMYIKDNQNAIVGPNKEMNWIKLEDMDPVSDDFKKQLTTKTKAAAWFVSSCYTKSKREVFVESLQEELENYDLEIDVYGGCGKLRCSRENEDECDQLVEDMYYFYLAFENSFSEDYVTEKLLRALKYNAIPIVYGGANYTRFMPDGIYLNARELGVEKLAEKMNELINDSEKYAEYFKWKKYYSYHRQHTSVETEPYCLFCATLNDNEMVKKTTIYKDFRKWWNPPDTCRNILKNILTNK